MGYFWYMCAENCRWKCNPLFSLNHDAPNFAAVHESKCLQMLYNTYIKYVEYLYEVLCHVTRFGHRCQQCSVFTLANLLRTVCSPMTASHEQSIFSLLFIQSFSFPELRVSNDKTCGHFSPLFIFTVKTFKIYKLHIKTC